MIDLRVKNEDLKDIFKDSKLIGNGFFGTCLIYKDMFIKVDSNLYDLHKMNNFNNTDWCYLDRTRWEKINFCNIEQLLILEKANLKLTKTPIGFIRINDDPIGIILNYFKDYKDINTYNDLNNLKIVLYRLLNACLELESNHIAQEDLVNGLNYKGSTNVLVKNNIPQIIDMDGVFIKCGKDYVNSETMYEQLSMLISHLYNKLGINNNLDYVINSSSMIKKQIKELERLR